jgi:3-oxoacyl-[acyl-carrier protein] reductase
MNKKSLLNGKTAVITGSNRGIGLAILELFAAHGSNIVACARTESEEFIMRMENIAKVNSVSIEPVFFDMENISDVKKIGYQIAKMDCHIDVLVNNAGVASGGFFQMTSLEQMRKIFEVNFFSQVVFTQIISRKMTRNKSGSIINIASIAGLDGGVGMLSYGSSKAALISASKTMASELGRDNVRVNAIAPTITKTDMYYQMDSKAREKLISSSALGRVAESEEIANAALFLASELSSFVNGQVICLDGGRA